ncbi:MAG: hypothetical protein HY842_09860 [Bacteroidetes bacterium]|nr:hypothetical protein [Bacteroidota bacterium]
MKQFPIILLASLLTGCFEIREEVNMKADGSGEVLFTVNLSQSKDNVRNYMAMGTVEGYKVPKKEEVEAGLERLKTTMSAVPGMSTVMTKSDWSSYIFTVSGRFAHVEALNKAMETVAKEFDKEGKNAASGKSGFGYNNTQFRRTFSYPSKSKEFQALPSMQQYVLETAKMTSIYRFERSIRNASHPKAQLSPSGKAVMLTLPVSELMQGTGTLANTISF